MKGLNPFKLLIVLSVTKAQKEKFKKENPFHSFLVYSYSLSSRRCISVKRRLASPSGSQVLFTLFLSERFLSQLEEAAEGWCW